MQGQADPRYQVWEVLVQMLSYHHPSAFLFENVPMPLRHNKGDTWKKMREQVEALGYHVQAFELNTAVYSVDHPARADPPGKKPSRLLPERSNFSRVSSLAREGGSVPVNTHQQQAQQQGSP
jgi:hypothetical protein